MELEKFILTFKKNNIEGGVVAKPGIATGSRSYNGQL